MFTITCYFAQGPTFRWNTCTTKKVHTCADQKQPEYQAFLRARGVEILDFFRFHLSPFPQKRLILRLDQKSLHDVTTRIDGAVLQACAWFLIDIQFVVTCHSELQSQYYSGTTPYGHFFLSRQNSHTFFRGMPVALPR